jgi:hypothetical protein
MAALSDLSDVINRLTGGNSGTPEHIFQYVDSRVAAAAAAATVAGRYTSLFTYNTTRTTGVAPGAVAVPTNATPGGMIQTDPGGGRQKWLTQFSAASTQPGVLILYDRLLHISGLDGTNVGAQSVGGTLTRYTDGIGNQIWIEIYTQIGATSRTITAAYDDEGGNPSTSQAVAIGNTGLREAQRIIPLTLAAGDKGVTEVTSVTLSATTGTAGDFGVTVAHPLVQVECPWGASLGLRDLLAGQPALPEILTDACLALAWVAAGTTAPQIMASASFIEA